MGTLVHLDRPVPRLVELLGASGCRHPHEAVAAALWAEIRHYRANLHRGGDARGLEELRDECADVLAAALPPPRPSRALARDALLAGLRFRLYPEAATALARIADAGVPMAVVSNWDVSLGATLTDLGVGRRFAAVVTSAEIGAAKPDPAPFLAALAAMGVAAPRALHCGDDPRLDCAGARAVGMRAVTVARDGAAPGGSCPVVADLGGLADLVACPPP